MFARLTAFTKNQGNQGIVPAFLYKSLWNIACVPPTPKYTYFIIGTYLDMYLYLFGSGV